MVYKAYRVTLTTGESIVGTILRHGEDFLIMRRVDGRTVKIEWDMVIDTGLEVLV
jgi:predicted Ser/Thr protein kinase